MGKGRGGGYKEENGRSLRDEKDERMVVLERKEGENRRRETE